MPKKKTRDLGISEAAIGPRVSIPENIESNVRDTLTLNLTAVISGLAGDRSTVFEIPVLWGEDGRIRSAGSSS